MLDGEEAFCSLKQPFRRERHAHTELTAISMHTQNSSTPTLTPAGEGHHNTTANQSRSRKEHGVWNPGRAMDMAVL